MEQTLNCKSKATSFLKKLFLEFAFCFCFFGLMACQSTDQSQSYIGTGTNITYKCDYDVNTGKTKVVWSSYIQNDTIYNITKIGVKFNYYLNETKVDSKTLYYELSIKHGKTKTINYNFVADQQINKIEYDSWAVTSYTNVWDTYKTWWIATIVIASVLAVAYVAATFIADLELEDVFEFIEEHFYFVFIVAIPFVPYLISGLSTGSWSWVPAVIIGGGILSVIILGLLGHFVRFLIEEASFGFDFGGGTATKNVKRSINKNEENFNPDIEDVSDYLDDEDHLLMFPASKLRDFCRENKIKGYSSLSKDDLVDLIMEWAEQREEHDSNESDFSKQIPVKKTTSRKKRKVTFDSIAGLEKAKEVFKEKVVLPFEHPEIFEKFGKKAGGGIFLYGLPGTGKTMFAEAASNELNALFIPIKCSDIKSKWYGESEKNVKKIFNKARKAERAIIFFDEFEAIGAKRTDDGNNGNNDLVPEILAEMQGIGSFKSKSTIMVIAATNKPWAIDSSFMRPGRFDEKILIPLPDFEARKKLFEIQLSKLPVADDLDYEYLANVTDGFNGADIKEVCEKLKMSAIKDSLEKETEQTIGMDDVQKIEKDIKSSVSNEDIVQLQAFEAGLK